MDLFSITRNTNIDFLVQNSFVKLDASSTPELQTNEAFFAASGSSMLQAKGQLIFVGGGADSVKIYTYNISKNTWKTNNPGIASGEAKGYFSIGSKNKNEFWDFIKSIKINNQEWMITNLDI